ncbi:hypothetical protein quinque_004890 [Culex quinquefasciatus]
MLPSANPRQPFRNFRAFMGLIQEANGVESHDAGTQTELQIETAPPEMQLPPEVWRHIFRHLSVVQLKKVRRVCRGWKQLVDGNPRLLSRMVLMFPAGKIMDEHFELDCKMRIPSVAIEGARIISFTSRLSHDKPWWTSISWRLTSLSLDDTKICVFELARMLKQSPYLEEMTLVNLSFPSYNLSRVVKCDPLRRMRKFAVFGQQYDVIFKFFGEAFPRLKELECDDPLEDQDDDEELVHYLKTAQNSLEAIKIAGTNAILDTLHTLKQLELKQIHLVSVAAPLKVLRLVQMHPTITVLILKQCMLSNADIAGIGRALPHLRCFESCVLPNPNHPNEYWQPRFLATMPKLDWLAISGYTSGKNLNARFDGIGLMGLRELRLSNLQINKPGHLLRFSCNIFRVALVNVKYQSWSDMFDSIQYDMVWSLRIWAVKVETQTENLICRFRNLRLLELCDLPMNESLLVTIFELTSVLEGVRIERLEHASDEVLRVMVSKNGATLRNLSLRSVEVTDRTADHIIEACSCLELLDIDACEALSDAAIARLKACGKFELKSHFEIIEETA